MSVSFLDMIKHSVAALEVALKPRYFWTALLLIAFGLSAFASFSLPDRRAVVLWFPAARSIDGSRARSELRYIPAGLEVAEEAGAIVEEALLGPMGASARPIAVPDANVLSSAGSSDTLYIDVSSDVLFGRIGPKGVYEAPPLAPRLVMDYIRKSLAWNFPFKRIVLTIDGLEPAWGAANSAGMTEFK